MNKELEKKGLRSVINTIKFFRDKKYRNDILCKDCTKADKGIAFACKNCSVEEESLKFDILIGGELENYYDLTIDFITREKNEKFWEE